MMGMMMGRQLLGTQLQVGRREQAGRGRSPAGTGRQSIGASQAQPAALTSGWVHRYVSGVWPHQQHSALPAIAQSTGRNMKQPGSQGGEAHLTQGPMPASISMRLSMRPACFASSSSFNSNWRASWVSMRASCTAASSPARSLLARSAGGMGRVRGWAGYGYESEMPAAHTLCPTQGLPDRMQGRQASSPHSFRTP